MADLAGHLKAIPELKACVGAAADALVAAVEAGESEPGLKHALRDAFSALMRCDPATVRPGSGGFPGGRKAKGKEPGGGMGVYLINHSTVGHSTVTALS